MMTIMDIYIKNKLKCYDHKNDEFLEHNLDHTVSKCKKICNNHSHKGYEKSTTFRSL